MSRCQHLAGVPSKPARAQQMSAVYLARGVQATTAIENTLSEAEVQEIVAKEQRAGRQVPRLPRARSPERAGGHLGNGHCIAIRAAAPRGSRI